MINVLRVFGWLVAVLIGSIPFLAAVLFGLLVRSKWIAVSSSMAFFAAITLLSSSHPEFFRFGPVHLDRHLRWFINGIPDVATSTAMNLIFSGIGAMTGIAFREGYRATRSFTPG
jgi:hypothetical protein